MKLHTKLTLSLLVGLLMVVTLAQALQYTSVIGRITRLSEDDVKAFRAREEQSARNLCDSIAHSVAGSLERGEMQKFTALLEQQRNVKGLVEFSLFDRNGVVSHSSSPAAIKRPLPVELKDRLLSDTSELVQRTPESIEIYRPQVITADCVRCHTAWQQGRVGGVNYLHFSTAELASAERQARATLASTRSELLRNNALTILGVVAVLVAAVYVLVRRFIGKPLGLFVSLLEQFEKNEGDMTRRIPIQTRDEIGGLAALFNRFIDKLNRAIGKSQHAAVAVSTSATAQAQAVAESSASMAQMADMTRRNADWAQKADSLIQAANTDIAHVHERMQTLTTAMDQMSQASSQVVKIIKTIDEIAFQTNLLALNAAVEAARAGQAGAGFAVVAADVRRLAMQSSQAAGNITELIEGTVSRVRNCKEMVDGTGQVFQQVAARSREATDLVGQIAGLSREQAQGIDQVSKMLSEMDASTQQSAAQAGELKGELAAFRTT